MEDYDKLLDEAMEEAPEDVGSHERFETPNVETRKDGKRTVLENIGEIAKKVNRSKRRVSKNIQDRLGTAGILENEELVLKGKFRKHEIEDELENYIEERVICPECGAPDTTVKVEKEVEYLKCQACGARSTL